MFVCVFTCVPPHHLALAVGCLRPGVKPLNLPVDEVWVPTWIAAEVNKQINQNEAEDGRCCVFEQWKRNKNLYLPAWFHHVLSSWVRVKQSNTEEHTLEHYVTYLYLFWGFVMSVCSGPGACAAGFEHTLAGKGPVGCVLSLPCLGTKHAFSHATPLPHCQHRREKQRHLLKWLLWGRQNSCLMFTGSSVQYFGVLYRCSPLKKKQKTTWKSENPVLSKDVM